MIIFKLLLQLPLIVCLIEGITSLLGRDEWWIILPISYLMLSAYDFADYIQYKNNDEVNENE